MSNRLLLTTALALVSLSAFAQDGDVQSTPEPAPAEIDLQTLPSTLLLSLEEMVNIEAAIADGPLARTPRDQEDDPARFRLRDNLYVSAIVYAGPQDWTVWINGRPLSPGTPSGIFEVLEVGPTHVRVAVPWGEGGTRTVMLRSHQTFVPRRGDVLEGRY